MAYLDATSLHTRPVEPQPRKPLPPASLLFPHGPEWAWRFQRNQSRDKLDKQFMLKDQGPPMYRLMGHHYNMYTTPCRPDLSTYSRSYHYEPRQHNTPGVTNQAVAFPTGPPPAQVAMFDQMTSNRNQSAKTRHIEMPNPANKSYKTYDKYRYLTGPPCM